MGLGEQHRSFIRRDAGYAMAGLLVAIAIMGIVMSMIMPAWRTWAQREREAELIFRGEQYKRAIELYQRRFAGAYPSDMETLVDQRFLRKLYTDPMTKDGKFDILTQGSLRAAPGEAPPSGTPGVGQQQEFGRITRAGETTRTGASPTPFSRAARESNEGAGAEGGGIIGVVSSSAEASMARYDGRDRYDQWLFVYLPQAAQPGVATGAPGTGGSARPGIGGELGSFGTITGQPGVGARGRGGRQPTAGSPRSDGPSLGGQRPGAAPRR